MNSRRLFWCQGCVQTDVSSQRNHKTKVDGGLITLHTSHMKYTHSNDLCESGCSHIIHNTTQRTLHTSHMMNEHVQFFGCRVITFGIDFCSLKIAPWLIKAALQVKIIPGNKQYLIDIIIINHCESPF